MNQIRVLIAEMPALHADIVKRIIGEQADMAVVGEVDVVERMGQTVDLTGIDVVLTSSAGTGPACAHHAAVWEHPWLRLVALDGDRHDAFVETRLHEWRTQGWPQNLVEVIRHAATPPHALRPHPPEPR